MQRVNVKGVANPIDFPDDMDIEDIKSFLQKRFAGMATRGDSTVNVSPRQASAQVSEPSLMDRAAQGIGNALASSGLVSDNFGAQQIGRNIATAGEFLPGIGDAAAGDEFGTALAQGDGLGMALGALGAIPLVGDAAKKIPSEMITFFHGGTYSGGAIDKTKGQRGGIGQLYATKNKESAENFASSGFYDEEDGDLDGIVTELSINKNDLIDLNSIRTDDFINDVGVDRVADIIRIKSPDQWDDIGMEAKNAGFEVDEWIKTDDGKSKLIDYIEEVDPDSSFEGPAVSSVDFGAFLAENSDLAGSIIKGRKGFLYYDKELEAQSVALVGDFNPLNSAD